MVLKNLKTFNKFNIKFFLFFTERKIYVGGLPSDITERILRSYFQQHSEVKEVNHNEFNFHL